MKNRDAGLNTDEKLQNDPGTYNHPMQIQWHFKVWRSRVIPFVIGENLSNATRDVIGSAIQRIQNASCLTFREAVDSDQQWIKFVDCPLCQCGFVGKFVFNLKKYDTGSRRAGQIFSRVFDLPFYFILSIEY